MSDVKKPSPATRAVDPDPGRIADEPKHSRPSAVADAAASARVAAGAAAPPKEAVPEVETPSPVPPLPEASPDTPPIAVLVAMPEAEAVPAFTEQIALLSTRNVEALIASSNAATRSIGALTQEAVEIGQRNFRHASSMLRSLAEARSPTELISVQSQYAHSVIEDLIEETARVGDTVMRMFGEIVEPILAPPAGASNPAATQP